jgi:hypothetical protein
MSADDDGDCDTSQYLETSLNLALIQTSHNL